MKKGNAEYRNSYITEVQGSFKTSVETTIYHNIRHLVTALEPLIISYDLHQHIEFNFFF